jgi:hypothetical protein
MYSRIFMAAMFAVATTGEKVNGLAKGMAEGLGCSHTVKHYTVSTKGELIPFQLSITSA